MTVARRLNQSPCFAVLQSNFTLLPCQKQFINYIKCILTGIVTAPAIFVLSTLTNCYVTSVSPEFGTTSGSESCLCRATVEPITVKFGTAEARRLNWLVRPRLTKYWKNIYSSIQPYGQPFCFSVVYTISIIIAIGKLTHHTVFS